MGAQLAVMAGIAAATAAANAAAENRREKKQKKENRYMLERQHQLGLDMWAATGTQAQVGQLEAAGLNKALMYAGKGGGGQSAGMPTGQPAQMADQSKSIGMALQTAMMAAQVKNIEADTKQKEVTTEKTAGTDTTESQSRIAKLAAETQNAALQNQLMQFDKKLKAIEVRIQQGGEQARTEQPELVNREINQSIEKIVAETRTEIAKGKVAEGTAETTIKQAHAAALEQALRISLQRQGIIKQGIETQEIRAKIEKISEEIIRMQEQTKQGQEGLDQNEQRILLEKIQTEFNTGDSAETLRWINAIGNLGMRAAEMYIKKGKPDGK